MPTTVYDSSLITQRRRATTESGSFISRISPWNIPPAGTSTNQPNTGYGVIVDSNNNIIVTGSYDSNPVTIYNTPGTLVAGTLVNTGLYDVFLVKYTSNGFVQLI